MLVKSADLCKSALDMNVHYFELLEFLQSLSTNPSILLDAEILVFKSEPRIYSDSTKLNHRLASKYIPVRMELYQSEKQVCVVTVSEAMSNVQGRVQGSEKCSPTTHDTTESVFGAND